MYLIVLNIPKVFNSKELRNYFFDFIEKSAFTLFHFRHRPEHHFISLCNQFDISIIDNASTSYIKSKLLTVEADNNNTCCLLKANADSGESFIKYYNNKHWVDLVGNVLKEKCIIYPCQQLVDAVKLKTEEFTHKYYTKKEIKENMKKLSFTNIESNIEFLPPDVMPFGNIGTRTKYFTELIKKCLLPSSVIEKLGIQSMGKRVKKYGSVPFNYGTSLVTPSESSDDAVYTARGDFIPSIYYENKLKEGHSGPQLELLEEAEDGNDVEEWERYESFHDDVSNQDRNKERIYEPEIEQTWEKGGPGVVFYTDAQFWKQQEGDFDEQTTDEWDVDMSCYYEEGAGDKDARDCMSMQEMDKLRAGLHTTTVFKKPKSKKPQKADTTCETIGRFEAHTRGVGRRIMEAQGWRDGIGLGKLNKGLAFALEEDGQHPADKKGFGFHGEKIILPYGKITGKLPKKRNHPLIGTIYDQPLSLDPPVKLHRTGEPSRLSHRH